MFKASTKASPVNRHQVSHLHTSTMMLDLPDKENISLKLLNGPLLNQNRELKSLIKCIPVKGNQENKFLSNDLVEGQKKARFRDKVEVRGRAKERDLVEERGKASTKEKMSSQVKDFQVNKNQAFLKVLLAVQEM